MITAWRIRNFKSYSGDHSIPLSWVNIVAGSNSSGKSTLIQSILALKQTVQYGSPDKSLLLNGPLLRMGSFDDVVNSGHQDEEMSIGFDCVFKYEEYSALLKDRVGSSPFYFNSSDSQNFINRLSLALSWRAAEPSDEVTARQAHLSPDLLSSHIGVSRNGQPIAQHVTMTARSPELNLADQGLPYNAEFDSASSQELGRDRPDAITVGAFAQHFLPRFAAVEFNASARRASEIASEIFNGSYMHISSTKLDGVQLSYDVIQAIEPWAKRRGISLPPVEPGGSISASAVKEIVSPATDRFTYLTLGRVRSGDENTASNKAELDGLIATVTAIIVSDMKPERSVEAALPASIREGSNLVTSLLQGSIRYLGPLRNPPRPVYQLEALPSNTDVGFRGEHTAAILDLNANLRITYFSPPKSNLSDDFISSAVKETKSLHDAVVEWLSYLGVAEEVATSDEGVFGNRLRVMTEGSGAMHDLTNVGVGVSQVLPIVVMALLAPKAALLIFEQPELHLHPKVQARLADFFLALALDGKQTIAETHSEYLVDRLRLRIALSEGETVNEYVNILFSHKTAGQTNLIPIEVTEYGAIVNWPEDFFDQSQNDVSRILNAASAKRRARRAK